MKIEFLNKLDIKLAESLSPLIKKLDKIKGTAIILGEVIKKSNSEKNKEVVPIEIDSEDDKDKSNLRALPNSNKFSTNMMETVGALKNSKNTLKLMQDD